MFYCYDYLQTADYFSPDFDYGTDFKDLIVKLLNNNRMETVINNSKIFNAIKRFK